MQNTIRNLNATDNAELNRYAYKGRFTYFDWWVFMSKLKKKQTLFVVTKLNIVHTGVITNHSNNYDCIAGPSNLKSECFDKQEFLIDKDGW